MVTAMANYWVRQGRQVAVITMTSDESQPFFPLDPRVQLVSLNVAGESNCLTEAIWNNVCRIRALRDALRSLRPQVVLSFVDRMNVVCLAATIGTKLRVVVSERTDPAFYNIGGVWQFLRWLLYRKAHRIVVQTDVAREYFLPRFDGKVAVIPNPVLHPSIHRDAGYKETVVVAMGRFSKEKRFDLLLKAFGRLKNKYPDWTLTILGDGALRPLLESLRDELGLAGRVRMPGNVSDPYAYLHQASLFVMCSDFEGFPNALCEAMACGLPVIATDCPSGPREIVRDGKNGVLIPPDNEEALVAAMDRLIADREERQRLGAQAADVIRRFSIERVMKMWDDVLIGSAHEIHAG